MSQGIRSYRRMLGVFERWGIVGPIASTHVVPKLRGTGISLATYGVDVESFAGYYLEIGGGPRRQMLIDFLTTADPDYFVCDGHGNGYSDMWGFVVRAGGMFAAVQCFVGDSFRDPTPEASRVFRAYNAHLAVLAERGRRKLAFAVRLSTFRNDAMVFVRESCWPGVQAEPLSEGPWADERRTDWLLLADARTPAGYQRAEDLVACGDLDRSPDLKAAVQFLLTAWVPRTRR